LIRLHLLILTEARFAQESLTVVESGGPDLHEKGGEIQILYPSDKITPKDWKETVFTSIMKQELKGGVVEYNSESLEAIQMIE